MKKILIFIVFTLFLFGCKNKQPNLITLTSKFIPTTDSILVFTPENIDLKKRYGLVILLNGWSGDFKQWNSICDLQEYSNIYNFIIVTPNGFYDSWYLNSSLNSNFFYEDYFKKVFLPYIKTNFPIDTTNIFISGLSMGGHGAITLFLKNSELFKCAASSSGILNLTKFPDKWGIKNRIGNYKDFPEIWKNNSAFYLLDSCKIGNKPILIDCGTEDFAYSVNLNFAQKALNLGINLKFYSVYGKHSKNHWKKMLPIHLDFFANQL